MACVADFVLSTDSCDVPQPVRQQALVQLIDLIAVATGGSETDMFGAAARFAAANMQAAGAGDAAPVLFGHGILSRAGAAFANACMIDSCDAHDGHAGPMGHAGVALLPTLLALSHGSSMSGARLLTTLVVGYEVALRAGIARTDRGRSPLGSGAWNAIGCAAIGARCLGLDSAQTRHALGIAEFNAPISPIGRSVAHPTMVKDAAGPGALAGTMAALLAAQGFTGAPAECISGPQHRALWSSLGERWEIMALNFKPYPIIKWAEPAVEAALELVRQHRPHAGDIRSVEIQTFAAAATLDVREPETAEQAQYSLAFPVACALATGRLDGASLSGRALSDPTVVRLSRSTTIRHCREYDADYPAKQMSRVAIEMQDGSRLASGPHVMLGAQEPLTMERALAKLRSFSAGANRDERQTERIIEAILSLPSAAELSPLQVLYAL